MVHVLVTTIVIAFILGTVSVPGALGRDCYGADIFKGSDYTFAAIPKECNTLDLRNSNGGAGGATAVAVVTAIDANTIGDKGVIALAAALKVNTVLTKLSGGQRLTPSTTRSSPSSKSSALFTTRVTFRGPRPIAMYDIAKHHFKNGETVVTLVGKRIA
eukprot:gene10554-30279_t